jgi:hypothetical protein
MHLHLNYRAMSNGSKLIHDLEKRKYEVVWTSVAKKSIARFVHFTGMSSAFRLIEFIA